jgi:signal transduction histidine kinase/ligand-binding sensor domain-containing protein
LTALIAGLWLVAATGSAQQAFSSARPPYTSRNWRTADGLPQNSVRTILQTSDRYLWLGTFNGLARFDGVRFTAFTSQNTPALSSDHINALCQDRNGTLWVATRGGLVSYRRGQFEAQGPKLGLPARGVIALREDRNGVLWVAFGERVYRRAGQRFLACAVSSTNVPKQIRAMALAPERGIWLGADNGLWRSVKDSLVHVPGTEKLAIQALAVDRSGALWVAAEFHGLGLWTNGAFAWMPDFDTVKVHAIHCARNGDLWIGGMEGRTYRLRNGRFASCFDETSRAGLEVMSFADDSEGNLWVGLDAGGLCRLSERQVQVLTVQNGLPTDSVTSLVEDAQGRIWFGTLGGALRVFDGGEAKPALSGGHFANVTAVAARPQGGIWFGASDHTLHWVRDGTVRMGPSKARGLRALFTDREGGLWVGTRNDGIEYVRYGEVLKRYTTTNGLSHNRVFCFAQDREGALWAGTERGLNRIKDGRVESYFKAHGLGSDFVRALQADSQGILWAGTLRGGLSAWRNRRFITLTEREGLISDTVQQILEDDFGYLWLGTSRGLMRVQLRDLHQFVAGKIRYVHGAVLGTEEGMAHAECGTGFQPSCLKGRDGRLWFAGGGLTIVNPRTVELNEQPTPVDVTGVVVDGQPRDLSPAGDRLFTPLRIPSRPQRIEIHYAGLSYSAPERVRFRYRLLGYDEQWVEAGTRRVAYFTHVPPGEFQFEVAACNSDGVWNEHGATLALMVKPAMWQTAWFRTLCLASVGATALGFYARRSRHQRKASATQETFPRQLIESEEQERQRIAAELHDRLGRHLLVIKDRADLALSHQTEPDKMAENVAAVSAMVSEAIRDVRAIAQNLRPVQLDELGLTKAIAGLARKISATSILELRVELENIDGLLGPELEINLFRIAQECLNNLMKHSQASAAFLGTSVEADHIYLVVKDNGRGFDVDQVTRDSSRSGFGLVNVLERSRAIGGRAEIHSAPGSGTIIEIEVPLH